MPFTFGGDYVDKQEIERQKKALKPIRLTKEKRKNSLVTLVHNLPLDQLAMKELLKDLKMHLGTGGSIKDDTLQIQGDHIEKVKAFLIKRKLLK